MREKEILPLVSSKLGICELNEMQKKMLSSAGVAADTILLSPTGSGKTLAFTLPLLKQLKDPNGRIQAVIIVPSRELAIQTAGVIRPLACGYKVTALYGGHNVEDEKNALEITPDIVVATPGRLLDHSDRHNLELLPVRMVVLDEFDKSLELGFEPQMKKLFARMKNISRTILTSATDIPVLPDFIKLKEVNKFDYLHTGNLTERLTVHRVESDSKDKLEALLHLIEAVSENRIPSRSIIFLNYRESAERVASFLMKKGVKAVLYHGALEQKDREIAISLFNNGSCPVLVATDLAARGLDIEEVKNIIHYNLPFTAEIYTHRNGRTARVAADGDVYVLTGPEEKLPDFIATDDDFSIQGEGDIPTQSLFYSLYISSGKKEKIGKGDIVGALSGEKEVGADLIGKINVFDHYCVVAVKEEVPKKIFLKEGASFGNLRIKGKNHRVRLLPE